MAGPFYAETAAPITNWNGKWLLRADRLFADKDDFYKTKNLMEATDYYFNKLAGNGYAYAAKYKQGA